MTQTAFLNDSTLCIGCKACEVACKEWNGLEAENFLWKGLSYDHTASLGHSTWRHVQFLESDPQPGLGGNAAEFSPWKFSSDVCKHCENAGCLEACPTGSIVRTEFGGVFVQPDVCNGCAYCVVACPFGVIERNPTEGTAFKCTFCYDRQKAGLTPACAKACPTESIKFGELEELRLEAQQRIETLRSRGMTDAELYDGKGGSVGGTHALFIVRGDPRSFNLPPQPEVPTRLLKRSWASALFTAAVLALGCFAAFGGRDEDHDD
jgi:formate dehydrogenase iron-sulfur subunit